MEKYYLANLALGGSSGLNADLRRKVKLVEIHYARRPPTFGLVYFKQTEQKQPSVVVAAATAAAVTTIQLTSLEFSDNNVAKFCTTKSVSFSANQLGSSHLVDFDTNKWIMMDENGSHSGLLGENQAANCIALAQDGNLFGVKLLDESVNGITSGCDLLCQRQLNENQFVSCQLQQNSQLLATGLQTTDEECYVHLLAHKTYYLNKLSNSKLQSIHKYSITPSEWSFKHFKSLLVLESNCQVVLLELNDSSIRIVQHGICLATVDQTILLGPNQRHLISTGSSNDETTIMLSYGRSKIVAHSLLINSVKDNIQNSSSGSSSNSKQSQLADCPGKGHKFQRDPDGLLPREPSFELDKCWSIDLNDIDSIRCLNEEEEELGDDASMGCLCLMWSAVQLNPDNSMGKFLVVLHKFHLLVYTFEQKPSLPFSVVYDRSFLKVQPLKDGNQTNAPLLLRNNQNYNTDTTEFLDPKLRPRLVHNFKLIGAHPMDSLFNSIFLAKKCYFVQAKQFAQLGLLIGFTSSGDLLAFKCSSSQVAAQRNSLYQQLVADSIRGNSLLTKQIELMQSGNRILQEEITNLELRSTSGKQSEQHLERFLKTELKVRDDIGCLYNLSFTMSDLVRVKRIVVLSTVNSFILHPTTASQQMIKSIYIDNRTITMKDDDSDNSNNHPILMGNIDSQKLSMEEVLRGQSLEDEEFIYNCAIIDFWSNKQIQRILPVDLPIFIMDGQLGNLRVLYELDNLQETLSPDTINRSRLILSAANNNNNIEMKPTINNTYNNESQSQGGETMVRAHSIRLPIKELMSYQPTDLAPPLIPSDLLMSCQFTGTFSREKMTNWVAECFQNVSDAPFSGHFRSTFTHCRLEFIIRIDNQATVTSDDFIAIELIKKQVLKKATDDSIRLEITHSSPITSNLRHLIGLQHTNLSLTSKLFNFVSSASVLLENKQFDEQSNDGLELLLESLVCEMNFCGFPADLVESDDLVCSIRNDLKSFKLLGNTKNNDHQQSATILDEAIEQHYNSSNEIKNVLNDLVCGFIIDALVDYDKLQGFSKPANEIMLTMRIKLVDILKGIDKLDKNSFANTILSNWNEIKQKSQ